MDRRIKWAELKPGDIVEFRYEGAAGTGVATRTVLILAPFVRKHNLAHGLEIIRNRNILLDDGDLLRYLPVIGGHPALIREGEIDGDPYYRVNINEGAERGIYRALKGQLKEDVFRSYKISELKRAIMNRVTTKSEYGLLPEDMKINADKIYEAKILEARKEAQKPPSERKIGDAKPLDDLKELPEKVDGIDVEEVKKKISEEVDEVVKTMMEEMGTLIKSDEMGELLSAIETKKAFGDFDEELGKK
jgi:hypothetical protein